MDRQQLLVFGLTVIVSYLGLKACQPPTGGQLNDRLDMASGPTPVLSDKAHAGMPVADVELKSNDQAACASESDFMSTGELVTLTGTVSRDHKKVIRQ